MTGQAQVPGSLDTSFTAKAGFNTGLVSNIVPLPNGKFLVSGYFQQFNQRATTGLAILNPDGSVDPTFNVPDGPASSPSAIAVQADGKILVGGVFLSFNGSPVPGVVRLNPDGSVDSSFAPNIPSDSSVLELVVQSDGKILLATGNTTLYRLLSGGGLDPVFNNGAPMAVSVGEMFALPNGQILVAGAFPDTPAGATHEIRRFQANGIRDTSFAAVTNGSIVSFFVQPDGQYFIAGTFTTVNNIIRRGLARLNSNGSLDTNLNSPLTGSNWVVNDAARAIDGSYYVVGKLLTASTGTAKILRLNSDGSFFSNLSSLPEPTPPSEFYLKISVQSDQKVVLGGNFTIVNGLSRAAGILRLTNTGIIDTTFNPVGGAQTTGNVQALVVQSDAKIVFGGQFNTTSGQFFSRLSRLTLDGQIDPTFTQGAGFQLTSTLDPPPTPSIYEIGTQTNGGIVVAGNFTSYNGVNRSGFLRLNDSGNVDTAFAPALNGSVFHIAIQNDDRILILGDFTMVNNTVRNNIARLNADGSLDTSFNSTASLPGSVQRMVTQPDGKILLAGASIIRLNADGSQDTGFSAPPPNGLIRDVIALPDFRILVAGQFTGFQFSSSLNVARLNFDGSFDPTFSAGSAVFDQIGQVNRIGLQPDGKIVVAGNPLNNTATNPTGAGLIRLNSDGTADPTFTPGIGVRLTSQVANNFFSAIPVEVNALQILPSQGILLGGKFELYDGKVARSLARVEMGQLCQFTVSPSSAFFPQAGGMGSVTISGDSACGWQATGIPSWITGFPTSGTGTQTVTFTVAPNPGTMRRAFISISGQTYIVVQGDSCGFTLNPTTATFNFQGGTGTLTVTASSPSCQWTALNLPSWLSGIPFSGQGTQTFTFSVGLNTGLTRSAAINIGGQTITITQMANPCPFQVSPLSFFATGKFLVKTITVTTNPGCVWRATSSVTWIGILGNAGGTGSGTVTLAIGANPQDNADGRRIGAVSVAGQTILITQRPGRRRTTIGVQRPSNSKFYIRYTPTTGFADKEFIYGTGNDIALSGDWDGNGTDSVGVYRNGTFYLRNSNSAGNADLAFPYGTPGDIAVTGDWDGDGIDTVGVFRNGVFLLRNSNTEGPADLQVFYGQTGDKPVVGDWNGDGVDTIGIFRAGVFYLRNSNTNGFADIQVSFGIATDLPIVGDWDGDGTDTIGVYRNGEYYMRNFNTTGPFNILAYYGTSADVPVKGDWIHQ